MITDRAINTFIDSELVREHKEREALHEPSGKLSASMLYQPTRFQILKYLGIPRREFDPYVLGKFKRGIDVENWFVEQLNKSKFLIASQKSVEYRGVVGFADSVIDTDKMECKKGIIPLEIKSVTNAKLKRINNSEVDYHYRLQANLYALAMGVSYYGVAIVSAEDYRPDIKIFQTSELKQDIDQIIDKYNQALIMWKHGKLPILEDTKVKWTTNPNYAMYSDEWTDEKVKDYLKESK